MHFQSCAAYEEVAPSLLHVLINFVLPTFVCCMEIHAHILYLMAAAN